MLLVTHSPAQVIGWHKGTKVPEATLNRILFATRYTRYLDRHGYIRFQDWRLYGERGLAHQPVTVWVYEGTGTAIGDGGEFEQPLQISFGLVFSSWGSPDRPSSPGMRPLPTSSAGTFAVFLAT